MTHEIAVALVPVFFVVAVGYLAGARGVIEDTQVGGLNALVMTFALPIALFTALAASNRSAIIDRWRVVAVFLLVMAVVYTATYWLEHHFYQAPPAECAVQALTVSFPNCAAVALPLLVSVLGAGAMVGVAAALAVGSITLSPLTLSILERERLMQLGGGEHGRNAGIPHIVAESITKPIVIGPLLGTAWSLLDVPLPPLAVTSLQEIGAVTAGVALFLTGLVVSAQPVRLTSNALVSTFVALIVRPAIALGAIWALGLSGSMAQETLLLLAVPAGFFGVLLGLGYGVRAPVAGTTLLLSTIASAVTLSLLIFALPTSHTTASIAGETSTVHDPSQPSTRSRSRYAPVATPSVLPIRRPGNVRIDVPRPWDRQRLWNPPLSSDGLANAESSTNSSLLSGVDTAGS